MQPSKLKLITSNLSRIFLHSILSISTRLTSLLISIGVISLLVIYFNSPTTSIYLRLHPSLQKESTYSSLSGESNQKLNPWTLLSGPILKLTATFTTTTTDSYRFKPSRFSEPTSDQATISSACVEKWISSAQRCSSLRNPKPHPIDLLWTWVNDSATLNTKLDRYEVGENQFKSQPAYLHRQHDELKFSLRSSLESLPPEYINSRIILTADKFLAQMSGRQEHWISRPDWLTPHSAANSFSRQPHHHVFLHHHSQIFKFKSPSSIHLNESDWFQNHVPSHNSLAIESQFGHLTGIKNDFVYLNDDCFFINKFGEGDFTSKLFGPVFRIQFNLNVEEDVIDRSGTEDAKGEWPSLAYSNYLLNMRFGSRSRRYINHVAKVSNMQMMKEVSEIWEDEIFLTASSRFRGHRREVNMMFLTTWYQIEKQREALLHSFLMLKSDSNQDGILSDYEWTQMMKHLIGEQPEEQDRTMIRVFKPFRPRSQPIEELLGDYAPLQTDYEWLSSDGYPLINRTMESIPNYQTKENDGSRTVICELNITQCFPNHYQRSEDLMRWVAIEKPQCGDCLITLLVGKRPTGMEAFLPPATLWIKIAKILDQTVYRNSFSSSHKHFSQLRFHSHRGFSSSRLFPGSFLTDAPRIWAVRNLQRYQYVLGKTPSNFQALTTLLSSQKILNDLTKKIKNKSMKHEEGANKKSDSKLEPDGLLVTLNDRIAEFQFSLVESLFKNWLQSSWPLSAPWEKKIEL